MPVADVDVLIAGAGPTGLTAALEIVRRGFSCRIFDKGPHTTRHSKAVGINARSLELLEASGVTADLLVQGRKITRARIHDGFRPTVLIHLDRIAHERFNFILGLPQDQTEAVLNNRLETLGGRVEWDTELADYTDEGDSITGTVRRNGTAETIHARYLLGCDGAHSTVRRLAGIPFEGEQYPELWHLADVELAWDKSDAQMNIFALDGTVLFAVEIGPNRHRLIYNADEPGPLLPPGTQILRTDWESEFHISRRIVETYTRGRVFLAGDAAHIHPPAGGRGMNLGIEDAWEFAYRLAHGGLDTYSADRHKVGEAVIAQTDEMFRTMTNRNPLVRMLRNLAARTVGRLAFVQRRGFTSVSGLDPDRRMPDG